MTEWILGLIGLAAGVMLGAAAATAVLLARHARKQTELGGKLGADLGAKLGNAQTRAELLEARVSDQQEEIDRLRVETATERQACVAAEQRVTALTEQQAARIRQLDEQRRLLDDAQKSLTDAFGALGAKALQANNEQFLQLARKSFEGLLSDARGDAEKRQVAIDGIVKPIRALLEKQAAVVGDIEKKREVAYRGLEEQIKAIASSHEQLGEQTGRLVTALRRPEQRGRWGEVQLRNVVELAGMTRHCDFHEQPVVGDLDGQYRPDMIVRLPGGGVIVVDAKVALDAYLDAIDAGGDRRADLRRHAQQVATHVRKLSAKQYWNQFDRTPRIVVMFMPLESALSAALEVSPDLHTNAMKSNVMLASPTLLVALLRAVAYGWQQEDVAANARQISAVGRELYDRLGRFTNAFEKVGVSLDGATRAYNKAVGSLEARLLPSARELKRLHATTEPELPAPAPIVTDARAIGAIELKSDETPEATLAEVVRAETADADAE
ncbi:MAG: DNA recombination protein RmuC [Phycisphaerae bacterium]|nr:DNA recombination protein RmuC [Phycisphaerae bacterium]